MRVRLKVWLEKDGEPIISEGKLRLLEEIKRTGSIHRASVNLGLSYKRAHSQIKVMEERLGEKILIRERGKGTRLTEKAKRLISAYRKLREELLSRASDLEKTLPRELSGEP